MLELIPIEQDYNTEQHTEEPLRSALDGTISFYQSIGFVPPYISYLVKAENQIVGLCAFKGAPVDNKVELAYFTLPAFEGKGYATEMCRRLVELALQENKETVISARTLPEENASTNVLRKNGFALMGTVNDPQDGEVFEWVFQK